MTKGIDMQIKVGIGSALASKTQAYARTDPRPEVPFFFEEENKYWWVYPAAWFICLAILALVATGYSV